MDFAGFLILPFSALVAFITLLVAAVAGRQRPRLFWPFAFSSLAAIVVLYWPPSAAEIGVWIATVSMVVLWSSAIGTIIGALLARGAIVTGRWIKSR
jgi:alpha-beta hydrolase superfamily lysophospholipase